LKRGVDFWKGKSCSNKVMATQGLEEKEGKHQSGHAVEKQKKDSTAFIKKV